MPRRYPEGRRRRPGRRPPNRYPGRHGPPRAGGFTAGGLGTFYRAAMPGLRGGAKRAFFNQLSGGLIIGFALGGAVVGYACLGPPGAFLGLGVGIAAGGSVVERGRFYRG